MHRLTAAVAGAALALALAACANKNDSQSGRDAGDDGATVTTSPTPQTTTAGSE